MMFNRFQKAILKLVTSSMCFGSFFIALVFSVVYINYLLFSVIGIFLVIISVIIAATTKEIESYRYD